MVYRILVASYTDAVYTLLFDPSKPADSALAVSATSKVGHHPSWLERHPSDPNLFFTGLEQADGRLLALKYDQSTGEGQVLANVPSGGSDPCSILTTDTTLFVANYSSGTVGIYAIPSPSGPLNIEEAQEPVQFSGSGPRRERQLASHPHQVYLHKAYSADSISSGLIEEVLVPDLGSDEIWRIARNAEGKWEIKDEISFDNHAGGGPRHVVVYDSKLYTLLELSNKIVVHDLPANGAKPTFMAEATLPMPDDTAPLTMLAAEISCPPSNSRFPSAYLYVSNRNDPRPHGDIISIFSPLKDGKAQLEHVGDVPTGLAHVRSFAFFGPEDRYAVVGGANGGGVKVFERVDGGRGMREVAHLPAADGGVGLAPTCFLLL